MTFHAQHAHGFQQGFAINVWADTADGCLNGPYLLSPCLTGHTYLIFLQEVGYWGKYLNMCLWISVDASGFNTMAHHPILQVRFTITLTYVSGRDGYAEVTRLHGLHDRQI